jgi:hypothetical protein
VGLALEMAFNLAAIERLTVSILISSSTNRREKINKLTPPERLQRLPPSLCFQCSMKSATGGTFQKPKKSTERDNWNNDHNNHHNDHNGDIIGQISAIFLPFFSFNFPKILQNFFSAAPKKEESRLSTFFEWHLFHCAGTLRNGRLKKKSSPAVPGKRFFIPGTQNDYSTVHMEHVK